jgi:hypothetical protein
MSDSSQIVSSVVVDETGTVIVHDARPDNLEEGQFWSCTHRAVIKAACAIQKRDSVIPESGVFVSPDEGRVIVSPPRPDNLEEDKFWSCTYRALWDEEDVTRAQSFISAKFPGWKIVETDSDGETRVVELPR